MKNKQWPVWPQDQLLLPDLGSDAPCEHQDAADTARITPKKEIDPMQGKVICRVCGAARTVGMPCGVCVKTAWTTEDEREL